MRIYIDEIIRATNGKLIGNNITEDVYIEGVSIDSRDIKQNYLFVPNKTDKFDGEDYIKSAFENGAIATFVSKNIENIDKTKYYIYVDNIKEAFNTLAKYNRNKYDIPIIGVTGSVGKTTSKEMIATVLEEKYNVLRTRGNLNSELGLPMMLLELNDSHDMAVLEMGTDHEGEMKLLESMVQPTDSVIMNIGVCHLEKFKTRENILKEKSKIYSNIKLRENILLNADDDMLILQKENIDAMWYGTGSKLDVEAKNIVINNNKVEVDVVINNTVIHLKIPGVSKHLIYPAMVATYFGKKYGLTDREVVEGINKFQTLSKRMDIQKLDNGITIIDDTYNANPSSMKAAIDALEIVDSKEKIAILGDMFELGNDENTMHADIGKYLMDKALNTIIAIGNNMEYMYKEICNDKDKKVYYFKTKEDFYKEINNILVNNNCVILLKASRGMKFEEIIDKIKQI